MAPGGFPSVPARRAGVNPAPVAAVAYLVVATALNLRWTGLDHLAMSTDDHAFFMVVARMYDAVWAVDLRNFFNISFQSYGFAYFLFQLLVAWPALAADNVGLAILLIRGLTTLFGAGTLYILIDLARRRSAGPLAPWALAALLLAMPGYWTNGLWNHPDHQMLFFVVLSLRLLDQGDGLPDGRRLLLVLGVFGLAMSSKIQALFFAPGIALWLLLAVVDQVRRDGGGVEEVLRVYAGLSWRCGALVFAFFVLFNPYLIHPEGLGAFIDDVRGNAYSNLTNHGAFTVPTWAEKWQALAGQYLSLWAVVLMGVAAGLGVAADRRVGMTAVQTGRMRLALALGIAALPNLLYFLLAVNKTWTHYYLGSFVLLAAGAVLLIPQCRRPAMAAVAALLAVVVASAAVRLPSSIGAFGYVGLDRERLDAEAASLEAALQPLLGPSPWIVISPSTPLRPDRLGLDWRRLVVISGALQDGLAATASHLVLRRDDHYFAASRPDQTSEAGAGPGAAWDAASARVAAMRAGMDPEFAPCAETPTSFVFCRR